MRVDRDRAFADLALNAALRDSDLDRRDRALATELTYGTLRMRGRIDARLRQCLRKDLKKTEPGVRNLLRLGAYQILFLPRMQNRAAVSTSVDLAKQEGFEHAAGFVNGVLREVTRREETEGFELADPEQDPLRYLIQEGSLPAWLAERWLEQFGAEEAIPLAEATLRAPPRTVRVAAHLDLKALARRLGGRPCRYAPHGITGMTRDPLRDPGFARGEFSVQDEASQLVPLMLGCQEGDSVVDCCAAPGSKAVQLAEQVGSKGEVIALELRDNRLALIHQTARRLGLGNLRVLQRDAAKGFDLQGRLRFPRLLVDASCSGLGTLSRNPDARWRLDPKEITRLADRALQILDSVARYVEDGGALVYSVCTHTPEETSGVTERFLEMQGKFRPDDPRPYLPPAAAELIGEDLALRTLPHRHGCDGFYAVRLVKA